MLPALIVTAGGMGTRWLITSAWLRNKKKRSARGTRQDSRTLELLQHSVDDLRDDLRMQANRIREISGRIEFTERFLTENKRDQG